MREHWKSSLGFVLAAAGSAIGLGNIWMFPYVAGTNGGGAFVLVYLGCILLIGVPILLCELLIGRATQQSPIGAFQQLHKHGSRSANFIAILFALLAAMLAVLGSYAPAAVVAVLSVLSFRYGWGLVGIVGVLTGFVILAFYGVVGGWTLAYTFLAFAGKLSFTQPEEARAVFSAVTLENAPQAIGCQILFMTLCAAALWGGVQRGIERWSKILMPILFILMLVLILRSLTLPGAMAGVKFFLSPDFSHLTMRSVLQALGTAFFSLSLGMGVIVTYGSYLGRDRNIVQCVLTIVGLDLLIALMAGLAIFPAVFSMGFAPDGGTGLAFNILPAAFSAIFGTHSWIWSGLFFCALSIAALTSGMSILEVIVSMFIDQFGMSRRWAVVLCTSLCTALGALCAVSVADWSRLPLLHQGLVAAFGANVPPSLFDLCDQFTRMWLLPLGGVAIAIFTGWVWGTRHALAEMRHGASDGALDTDLGLLLAGLYGDDAYADRQRSRITIGTLWGIAIRFLAPILVTVAFLAGIGWIEL